MHRSSLIFVVLFALLAGPALAQQGAATGEPLVILTTSLHKAYLHQQYETHLEARGGITPLRWEISDGALPPGIALGVDGTLSGAPTETGEFKFTVKVTDSGRPAAQRNQQLCLPSWRHCLHNGDAIPKLTGKGWKARLSCPTRPSRILI